MLFSKLSLLHLIRFAIMKVKSIIIPIIFWYRRVNQGGHKPGKLREFEKLSKTQGNLSFFCTTAWKIQGKCKTYDIMAMKMYSRDASFPELLREKFENSLEISEKTQGILFVQNVATLEAFAF